MITLKSLYAGFQLCSVLSALYKMGFVLLYGTVG